MQAGQLNRRISIEAPSATQDNYGQPTQTWSTVLSTWAGIRAVTSKEVYASSGFVSELSHVLTIRYPAVKVNSTMRAAYKDRSFLIQAVSDPDEDRVLLNLLCKELNT